MSVDLSDGNDLDDFEENQIEFEKVVRILDVIANKKASYRAEIAGIKGMSEDEVRKILHKLEDENIIELLTPSIGWNDPRMLEQGKRPNFNSVKEIRQPTWYGLNSDLEWVLKVDKNSPDDPEYMDEYHRPLNDGVVEMDRSVSELVGDSLKVV